jgi:glycosyltransferase involved in cell wall biosynthesis
LAPDALQQVMEMRLGLDIHQIGARMTGNETYVRNLLEQYSDMKEPRELHLYHTRSTQENSGLAWHGERRRLWPHASMLRIPFSFPVALWRDKVDLAHFQYVSPPLCPCPTVVTIHDISYEFLPEFFKTAERIRMKTLIPLSARKARHVVTISEFSRQQLIEHYRLAPDKVTTTWLGVSPSFKMIADNDYLDEQLERLALSSPYILGVGNLQPRKNLTRLLRAYARLRKSGFPHQLVLVGQAAFKGHEVGAEIERLGLSNAVILTGYVSEPELIALYNRAAVFAYPSIYEGFGLPVIEAMACGVPVITSRVASMPEVAGDAAELVDPYSEDEIYLALNAVLSDSHRQLQMRQRGLERASLFHWRRTALQTLDVYRRSLS